MIPGQFYESKNDGGVYTPPLSYLDALWISVNHPSRAETIRLYDNSWRMLGALADQSPWELFTQEELVVAGHLGELPMDPCSDKPPVYRIEGESFVLYSVGEDFFDNGGVDVPWGQSEFGGDHVFWPVGSDSSTMN